MVESKCIVCGAKIVSQRKRKYCDACKRDRAWDWKKEGEMRKAKREKEAEIADLHSTMALSAKIAVATGLSYGQQVTFSSAAKQGFAVIFGGPMTTIEYLQKELRRVEISIDRARKKPNAAEEEMQALETKKRCLSEALEAVCMFHTAQKDGEEK